MILFVLGQHLKQLIQKYFEIVCNLYLKKDRWIHSVPFFSKFNEKLNNKFKIYVLYFDNVWQNFHRLSMIKNYLFVIYIHLIQELIQHGIVLFIKKQHLLMYCVHVQLILNNNNSNSNKVKSRISLRNI